jgi:hypothetical protein
MSAWRLPGPSAGDSMSLWGRIMSPCRHVGQYAPGTRPRSVSGPQQGVHRLVTAPDPQPSVTHRVVLIVGFTADAVNSGDSVSDYPAHSSTTADEMCSEGTG